MSYRFIRSYFLGAMVWLSTAPAFGQEFMELPPLSLVGNMNCCAPNPGSVVTIPQLIAQLSSAGLALDQMTKVGDANYTMVQSDRAVATLVPLSASRMWTLPPAGNMVAGHPILVVDLAGGVSGSNTLVIARAGTDTINGSGASLTISTAFGAYYLVSDGVRAWNAQPLGGISITPGGGLTSSVSASCAGSPITAFGTLSTAECVNAQTGTTYSIVDGDRAKLITASNAAAQAYTIAQAGAASTFQTGWYADIKNISTNAAGIVTVTPATSTINGAATLQIYPGQSVRIISDGANYQTAFATVSPAITASLGADVAMNNTANYFDGPSIPQGTLGTWWVSGTVSVWDTAGAANFFCKLWDGTTVIASSAANAQTAAANQSVALSGFITSPAANIRMSCRDSTATTGVIKFNSTGNSKDSTLSAHRIQ
jgi:hypothetical protein